MKKPYMLYSSCHPQDSSALHWVLSSSQRAIPYRPGAIKPPKKMLLFGCDVISYPEDEANLSLC